MSSNRIVGPFNEPPFSPFWISPLNSVPKQDTDERRVIVDLSWPIGYGVNDGIDSDLYLGEPSDLHFPTTDDIIEMIQRNGPGCLIYKRDLRRAYRQFPVDPADYKYLGYCWKDKFYFDTRLAMGQRTSALACQRSTRPLTYIMNTKGFCVAVYLDDFIGVEPVHLAWKSYYTFERHY